MNRYCASPRQPARAWSVIAVPVGCGESLSVDSAADTHEVREKASVCVLSSATALPAARVLTMNL